MILQNKNSTFWAVATFVISNFFGGSGLAWAGGYYTCTSPAVLVGTSSCSDGSIAAFNADPVCPSPQTLQNHVCVTLTPSLSDDAETIFNWAEHDYPQYFSSNEITQISNPWLYRYYWKTNTYAGVNNQDKGVYVLGGVFGPSPVLVNTVENLVKVANADPSTLYGVWRTSIPGAVWTSPGTYTDWLHVSTGLAVGDLIIRPDGTYIWNSYGGKSGSWVRGDSDYPVVLIDTVENKQWKVSTDSKHTGGRDIVIWDGRFLYYDGRK